MLAGIICLILGVYYMAMCSSLLGIVSYADNISLMFVYGLNSICLIISGIFSIMDRRFRPRPHRIACILLHCLSAALCLLFSSAGLMLLMWINIGFVALHMFTKLGPEE